MSSELEHEEPIDEPPIKIVVTNEEHTEEEARPITQPSNSGTPTTEPEPAPEPETETEQDKDTNEDEPAETPIKIVITEPVRDTEPDGQLQSEDNGPPQPQQANTDADAPPQQIKQEADDENKDEFDDANAISLGDIGGMKMMDRAHSDPLAPQRESVVKQRASIVRSNVNEEQKQPAAEGTDSTYLTPKRYHSHDDIHGGRGRGGKKGSLNIREISTETIAFKSELGREKSEEIVVPPRDVIAKMPFHSTPLTVEATNNAFYDFKERLNEMGFMEQAEAALVHTQCVGVEEAVSFILNNFDAIYHRFVGEGGDGTQRCTQCQETFDKHLVDANGNKIGLAMNEENYNHDDDLYIVDMYNDMMASIQEEERERARSKAEEEERERAQQQKVPSREEISSIVQKVERDLGPARKYSGETQLCFICFEEKPVDFFQSTVSCGHNQYCKECLAEHYKVKTKDGDVLKVKCIHPQCEREVEEEEILQYLGDDEQLQEKFRKFKRRKLLMLNENARFCPRADCEGYMIGSRLKPKLECPECKTQVCFNCSRLWHGYLAKCQSATEAQVDLDENEQKFYAWELNKDVKRCPKCKMRIEKNEGCNHMTCINCKYEFCWICKGKYSGNHFSEWNIFGCPGAQYNGTRVCSINGVLCPSCFPMWLRRLLVLIVFIILLPLLIVVGCLVGCVYGCALCVIFLFENVCCCCN